MTRWFPRLLLVTFLIQLAIYAIRPMASYRAISLGAGPLDLGIIASSFAVLSLLVAVPIGRWVDRWGEPRFVTAGAGIISLVSLTLLGIGSVPALALSQAVLGLGHIMSVVGTQTLIANAGAPDRRDARFGVYTVVVSLGQLAGPAVGGLLAGAAASDPATGAATTGQDRFGTTVVFGGAAAFAAFACLVAASLWWLPTSQVRHRRDELPDPPVTSRKALARVLVVPSMPQAMLASLTVLTSIDILVAYLPAYGEATGLPVEVVGFLLATRAAASMASRLVMLPLIALFTRRRLLVLSMMVPALALAALPLLDALALLYLAMGVIGFGLGLGQPITLAWVAGQAPPEVRGTAIGVRLSGNRLGQTALPAIVGAIAGATGLVAVFLSLAVMLGISALSVLRASFEDGSARARTM